ncbi:hypothetical protein LHEJCM20397_01810 [Lactobacillus helveticus]|nr:hypothetical protein CDA64_01950 [Lactobacillus helveticus]GFP16633.1 hypothetical protein LHEJCM20397_01810 [Lactobacillus helveticus]GIP67794.1 hypothetical protein LhelvAHU1049_19990 [Lactobacillus helveticus]
MPFFVIKKGLVLLEWKYFSTPKILDPKLRRAAFLFVSFVDIAKERD